MSEKLRIIFYGTPDFAVASLDAILEAGFNVLAVVTAPDRKAGRGMKYQYSPVKKYALEKGLDVLQPTNLKSEDFQDQLKEYSPNIQVVIAFRMMPEKVWNFPEHGTINLHASALPNYRGAAPINWAVINGEDYTGVTTFRLKHEIDTGNVLMVEDVPIEEDDTAGTMHDKLMVIGAELMVATLHAIEQGREVETPQGMDGDQKHAPKIFKADCVINWTRPRQEVYNLIRGLSPYPASRTTLDGKTFKIFGSKLSSSNEPIVNPGEILSDDISYLHVACSDGWLELTDVRLEGRKRMKIGEFLNGYSVAEVKSLG